MEPDQSGIKDCLSALRTDFPLFNPTYLSIGCGTGVIEHNLLQEYDITLSDMSFGLMRWLNRFHSKALVLSTFSVPFKSNSFDVIVSEGLFEHFEDDSVIQVAINELCRISKRYIVIIVPCSDSIVYTKVKAKLIERKKWSWGYERDFSTFQPYFDAANVNTIYETTIGGVALSKKYASWCPGALSGNEPHVPYPYLLSVGGK